MAPNAVHYPVGFDPNTRGLLEERDLSRYVSQAIHQLLLTAPGERVHRPDFGVGLRRMVFAATTAASPAMVQTMVVQALDTWLGHLLAVDEVVVRRGDASLSVDIGYRLRSGGSADSTTVTVSP
jgi:uncharacterized protein